jgi:hypothetical protein
MFAPSLQYNKRLRREDVDIAAMIAMFFFLGGIALGGFASLVFG